MGSDSDSDDSDEEEMVFRACHSFGKNVASIFESKWKGASSQQTVAIKINKSSTDNKSIDKQLKKNGLSMMATGSQGGSIRSYFIGERQDQLGVYMAEVIIQLAAKKMTATLKSDNEASLPAFKSYFEKACSN